MYIYIYVHKSPSLLAISRGCSFNTSGGDEDVEGSHDADAAEEGGVMVSLSDHN